MKSTQAKLKFRIPLLKSVHWLASPLLKRLGYETELRHQGELKLLLLRKRLRSEKELARLGRLYPRRLVLIPGFGDTPLSWLGILALATPFIKPQYDEIILLDFPGFGGFLAHEKCFPSLDSLLKTLGDVLESLRPHSLLGHSLGGWLAASYAAGCPEITRPIGNPLNYTGPEKLILMSPAGLFSTLESEEKWAKTFSEVMDQGYSRMRPMVFGKEPIWFKWVMPELSAFLKREDVISFMKTFRPEHNLRKSAHKIESEVWLVWGDLDTLCDVKWAEDWMHALSREPHTFRGKTVLIKGVGHSLQVEAPTRVAAILAQILSGRTPHRLGERWYKVIEDQVDSRFYLKAIK